MAQFAKARHNMVEGQIRPNKVTDPFVIDAFAAIPREMFVPENLRGVAYVGGDIAVGPGRRLMEPMVLARMLQEVRIRPDDVVLDVAAATGYSAAVLSRLAASVIAVEPDPVLAACAVRSLADVGAANVRVVNAPAEKGCATYAPYDAIVINGSVSRIPSELTDQLAQNGRMVVAVLDDDGLGQLRLYLKIGGCVSFRVLFEAKPCLAPGFSVPPDFVF